MGTNVQDLYRQMRTFGALIEKEVKDISQALKKQDKEKQLTLSREHAHLAEQILTESVSTANMLVDMGKYLETCTGDLNMQEKNLHHIVSKIERSLE